MTESKYKLVIFDLDGTLLDTKEGILASVRYTIDRFGFPMVPEEKLLSFIGPPIQDSFAQAFDLKGSILQEIATVFRDRYAKKDLYKAKPYEGIYEVFEGLKKRNVQTAIATYKREDYARDVLHYFGFDRYTQNIFGGDHENKLKKKDIIQKCVRFASLSSNREALMVGDCLSDGIGAMQNQMDFIAVTYGYGFRWGEDCACENVGVCDSPNQLLNLI